jgi:Ca-activated chloride channel homolog
MVIAATGLAAQQYRTGVELVTVPLTVSGRDSAVASAPLTARDFRVFEDGVEQQITLFDQTRRPISVCIILDSSQSMRGWKQRLATAAVDHVLARLKPEDEAAVIIFSAVPHLAMPWTPTPQLPRVDWTKWEVGGSTPLIDALKDGVALIDEARNPRPVILIVSDGEENASRTPLSQIARTRRQSETLVYAIGTYDPPRTQLAGDPSSNMHAAAAPRAPVTANFLPSLVDDSGGTTYDAQVPERAEAAARAFMDDLASQYTLGYTSSKPPDGKYRRLKIEPVRKQLRVRHRGGYLASPASRPSQ